MEKRLKRKRSLVAPQSESDVAGLINKMQQQLSAIEKKLDILISQPSKGPFEKNYPQKPSQRFNYSHRYGSGREGSGFGERTYARVICADCQKECEVPFKPSGDRPVYCRECFPKRRQDNSFSANRDNRPKERDFPREGRFDKRQKPVKNKEPFFTRRKKRA